MISREPTLERLAIARQLLLDPFGLTEASLTRALNTISAHRVDDADLYFQYTRSEGWSLEEGIVKSGSFSIDQGVGVRAGAGEKTAFAYSDDISEAALLDAARTVRTIAAAGQSRRVKIDTPQQVAASRSLYAGMDPIASLDCGSGDLEAEALGAADHDDVSVGVAHLRLLGDVHHKSTTKESKIQEIFENN